MSYVFLVAKLSVLISNETTSLVNVDAAKPSRHSGPLRQPAGFRMCVEVRNCTGRFTAVLTKLGRPSTALVAGRDARGQDWNILNRRRMKGELREEAC